MSCFKRWMSRKFPVLKVSFWQKFQYKRSLSDRDPSINNYFSSQWPISLTGNGKCKVSLNIIYHAVCLSLTEDESQILGKRNVFTNCSCKGNICTPTLGISEATKTKQHLGDHNSKDQSPEKLPTRCIISEGAKFAEYCKNRRKYSHTNFLEWKLLVIIPTRRGNNPYRMKELPPLCGQGLDYRPWWQHCSTAPSSMSQEWTETGRVCDEVESTVC